MYHTILVGTDASVAADKAIDAAAELARGSDAALVLLHVTEMVGGKGGFYPLAVDEDAVRKSIEDRAAALVDGGIKARAEFEVVRLGGPAHVIAEAAQALDADLVVVGNRGHSTLERLVLGSVPLRLLQLAHRPLLVVPDVAA